MPCFHPMTGWKSKVVNEKTGKRSLVFKRELADPKTVATEIKVPCGQCIGCRLERSRQWAMRCLHEASLYEDNCYLTLTYDDENLPVGGSLEKRDFQLFMKRLRKRFPETKIRYYYCGEYGDNTLRPHYHACLFNFDFDDRKFFTRKNGFSLYTSDLLFSLWPFGHHLIGNVTFDSAAYVARYITKKITGLGAEKENELGLTHYQKLDPDSGEIFDLEPEYTDMSRRPGIAAAWLKKYHRDVYPSDFVTVKGIKVRPPKFYDDCLHDLDPAELETIKYRRRVNQKLHQEDQCIFRLKTREIVQESRMQMLPRDYEKE